VHWLAVVQNKSVGIYKYKQRRTADVLNLPKETSLLLGTKKERHYICHICIGILYTRTKLKTGGTRSPSGASAGEDTRQLIDCVAAHGRYSHDKAAT
jgi:hypothetical protein